MQGEVRRTCVIALALLMAAPAALSAGSPAARQVVQSTADGEVAYSVSSGTEGEAVLVADVGDLHIVKSVFEDGRSTLFLRAGTDEVQIEITDEGISFVTRGMKLKVAPAADRSAGEGSSAPAEKQLTAIRVALARSRAAQRFRALAAGIRESGARGAFEEAVLLSGAVVSQLAGEAGAIHGSARRRAAAARARVRPARAVPIRDCWGDYEVYILWAYGEYTQCLSDAGGRLRLVWSGLSWCDAQYALRAESAWFQFITCSTIPIV